MAGELEALMGYEPPQQPPGALQSLMQQPPANPLTPIAGGIADLLGLKDAYRAVRGGMTEGEARDFAFGAMAGLLPVGRVKLPIRAASENISDLVSSNFSFGRAVGDRTMPLDRLIGGVRESAPDEAVRVKSLVSQMSSPGGYISRLVVDDAGNVIEGQHRLEALRSLGATKAPVTVVKDLGRGYDVSAMRGAIKGVGKLHPDQEHGILREALDAIHNAGSPQKALADYIMPQEWQPFFEAAVRAAAGKGKQ